MNTWTDPATGCHIAYDDTGPGGPPVVLIHAFPLCRDMWARQRSALAPTHRILTPDVFGFGGSGLPAGGWTVDSFSDACDAWLTGIGVTGPVIFGGLSMGGYIALAFARRHPQRVKGLILADTRADADTAEGKVARDKTIDFVRQNSAAAQIDQMLPKMLAEYTRTYQKEIEVEVRRMGAAQSVEGLVAALTALRDRPDSMPTLDGFRFPVLLIVGRDDVITTPAMAQAMASKLRDVTVEELSGAGHLSNLEVPGQFNAAVRRWLDATAD